MKRVTTMCTIDGVTIPIMFNEANIVSCMKTRNGTNKCIVSTVDGKSYLIEDSYSNFIERFKYI